MCMIRIQKYVVTSRIAPLHLLNHVFIRKKKAGKTLKLSIKNDKHHNLPHIKFADEHGSIIYLISQMVKEKVNKINKSHENKFEPM